MVQHHGVHAVVEMFRMSKPLFMRIVHLIRDDVAACDLRAIPCSGPPFRWK